MKDFLTKIIPWIITIVLFLFLYNSCNKQEDQAELFKAINDTLQITRNSLGEQVASIQVIKTENKKQFLQIKSKDSTIIALQQLVKKTKGLQSAIVIVNKTSNEIGGITKVTSKDTIIKDSVRYIYPEYRFSRSTQWDSVSIRSNKDSTHIEYKIFNKYDITTSYKRLGLFKGKVPIIDIVNKNPYTETIALRAYEVKCDCKRGQFFLLGLGSGVLGTLSINKLLSK